MREIPSLQLLCLRSVGGCSAEVTFAKDPKTNEPSSASKLLRSFHDRPVLNGNGNNNNCGVQNKEKDVDDDEKEPPKKKKKRSESADKSSSSATSTSLQRMRAIPMERTPCIGPGSARRVQANEVDLFHPVIGCVHHNKNKKNVLIAQHGNPALDCLQSYIDSLVELGRMDGARLGLHFFEEWKLNVVLSHPNGLQLLEEPAATTTTTSGANDNNPSPPIPRKSNKKRRRKDNASPTPTADDPPQQQQQQQLQLNMDGAALGSLSLHNCSLSTDTIEAMVEAQMGPFVGVLDLTGIHGLTDQMLETLLPTCPHLYRLSVKNCRRVTGRCLLECVAVHPVGQNSLTCLDVGGSFNITKRDLLDAIPSLPQLEEVHASGLEWDDASIDELVQLRPWKALSLGFSLHLSQAALKQSLVTIADSLVSLAIHFCEDVVDNALLGMMGRNLPNIQFLDVRGCGNLSTLTGWYDGRASANLEPQPLHVLARYSGLTEANVEETKRVHPLDAQDLSVILDGTGTGSGITVESRSR